MPDITLTFTKKQFKVLQYILSNCKNKEILVAQAGDDFAEQYKKLSDVNMEPENFETVYDAANYFSYKDRVWNSEGALAVDARTLFKANKDIFIEFTSFLFLSAKKRKYTFTKELRAAFAEVASEKGLYIKRAVNYYFNLYKQHGSNESMFRIRGWLNMPQIKRNKSLILKLASSKHRGVQIQAIRSADDTLYPFMLADITDPLARLYLSAVMDDPKFEVGSWYEWIRKMEQETGQKFGYHGV